MGLTVLICLFIFRHNDSSKLSLFIVKLPDVDDWGDEESDSDASEGSDRQRHAFLEEYGGALDRELASSSMQRSFARAEQLLSPGNQQVNILSLHPHTT